MTLDVDGHGLSDKMCHEHMPKRPSSVVLGIHFIAKSEFSKFTFNSNQACPYVMCITIAPLITNVVYEIIKRIIVSCTRKQCENDAVVFVMSWVSYIKFRCFHKLKQESHQKAY